MAYLRYGVKRGDAVEQSLAGRYNWRAGAGNPAKCRLPPYRSLLGEPCLELFATLDPDLKADGGCS